MRLYGRILEARADGVWDAVIIEAGVSLNGVRYTPSALREAVNRGVFEGAVIALYPSVDATGKPIDDHLGPLDLVGKATLNAVGTARETRWCESSQAVVGAVHLSLGHPYADRVNEALKAHAANGNLDVPGLSIDGVGDVGFDGTCRRLEALNEITIVTRPSAGGRFNGHRIAASVQSGRQAMDKLLQHLRENFSSVIGSYTGPVFEDHLKAHIAKRLTESADVREAFCAAVEKRSTENGALRPLIGDVRKRVTESADIAGMLSEAALIINIAREEVEKQTAAAIATAEVDMPKADPAPAPAAPAGDPMQESIKALGDTLSDLKAQIGRTAKASETETPKEDANATYLREAAARERVRESKQAIRDAVTKACLPSTVADALIAEHVDETGETRIVESRALALAMDRQRMIDNAIRETTGGFGPVVIRESVDKLTDRLAYLFSPKCPKPEEGVPEHRSLIRTIEQTCLNDGRLVESVYRQGGRRRIKEAIDATNFDQAYADALNKALLAEFNGLDYLQSWRRLVSPRPLGDFRTYKTIRVGYYDELPAVAERGPYTYLTTPTDQQETIQLSKKGGIESISMEQLLNDDLGIYQKMLTRLALAAAETRYEGFFDLIRIATQPTMTDSYKLTSGSRSPANLLTTALSKDAAGKTAFITAMQQMMKATGGSGKRKGIVPRFLIIPIELQEAGNFILQEIQGGETATTDLSAFARRYGIPATEVVVDITTTNATDWFLLADPNIAPVFEYGSLGGRDEPEIFVADDQRFGAVFTNDVQELKIRDIFAFAAVDPTGIQGNDV